MLTSFSSNAITAKARAIYGQRLTPANYNELIRQRSVSDVAAYLKANTSYSKYLKSINEMQIHRGQLEHLLYRSKLDKYLSLCYYDFSKDKGFYRYAVTDAEISAILKALMFVNSNSSDGINLSIHSFHSFAQEYACFDLKELLIVKDFNGILKVLENTPYYKILKPFNAPNGNINLKECELKLKTYYYQSIFQLIERNYNGDTKETLKEIIGIEIDLINLSLIYRLKYYFKQSNEEIKTHLLPFHYKLNEKKIDAILEDIDTDKFVAHMKLSAYSNKMKDVHFNYIEDYTKRLKYIISKKHMRFSSNAPISLFVIMTLIQIEIENIIIIIEGIRYNNPPSDIKKLLVLE